MKIKGRYVATIIFEFDYDAENKDFKPFHEILSDLRNGKAKDEIERNLLDWVFDSNMGKLTVEQQYADLYEVKDE